MTGAVSMNGSAAGGNGFNGNGGAAVGGEMDVVAYIGDIALGSLNMVLNATGGNARGGGNGGAATGGLADIAFGFQNAALGGTIDFGSASIAADAIGGTGGNGLSGAAGGAGGAAIGGEIVFWGSAAGGILESGFTQLRATATGGTGGNGGGSETSVGGAGGDGGAAQGGYIFAGTVSNSGVATSGGEFVTAGLNINSSAFGGNGGAGAFGTSGTGFGGYGGAAIGGSSLLLIRAVDASIGALTLTANSEGGDGGGGSFQGNGGNASTGFVVVESKDRFDVPTQRGNLIATTISATAIATGGAGTIAGTETIRGGNSFRIANGDASIGSVNFTIGGDIYAPTANSFDHVSVRDGTATITGAFSWNTGGDVTLDASNGTMTANSVVMAADNFVPNPSALPPPTSLGTYSAGSFDISTGGRLHCRRR